MKYLKKFETIEMHRIYWCVSTDINKLKKQLTKLNCPDIFITNAIEDMEYHQDKDDIFIGKYKNKHKNKYHWMIDERGAYFRMQGFKFMGGVILTQQDLDEIELSINSNKYNL